MFSTISITLQIIIIVALADLLSGAVHWAEDAYGTETTPVVGPLVIRPNIIHHHFPRFFTKFNWWQSSWELLLVGGLIAGGAAAMGCLTWQVISFVIISVNANQVHKWAHRTRAENGPVVSFLQDWKILQTPGHHGLHHTDPKNTYYCPMTNFVNPILERGHFWARLEAIIQAVTGIAHRQDTAVRGQGPGPRWLDQYKAKRNIISTAQAPAGKQVVATATTARNCRDCQNCRNDCRRIIKGDFARIEDAERAA